MKNLPEERPKTEGSAHAVLLFRYHDVVMPLLGCC